MIETASLSHDANFSSDINADRAYAAWASKPKAMPRFILRRTSGTIIRLQSGRIGTMALVLCALSIAGLAGIALLTLQ